MTGAWRRLHGHRHDTALFADLAEIDRRPNELDQKLDQLPTKQELADALRAFADQLDAPANPTAPAPDPEPDAS
ncbi:hypothetical protein [Streptomyces sp. NPDC058295]|jgi:hypothetical protein|uniref:hypothetical protein n=1 Tax=Streptomyces sp. NPDC058295 TaxID=3346431 RepID=UPI0036ED1958